MFPKETLKQLQQFEQDTFQKERAGFHDDGKGDEAFGRNKRGKHIYREDREGGRARYPYMSMFLIEWVEEKENEWTAKDRAALD